MAGNYGESIRIAGLKELATASKASGMKIVEELPAGNAQAAEAVKQRARQIADGVDLHAKTAAEAIKISASAAWAKLTLQRSPDVPFALGAEWGSKHGIERKGFSRSTVLARGKSSTYQRRMRDGTYKTFTRKGKALVVQHEGAWDMHGWNQFKDWRGNATAAATSEFELTHLRSSHAVGPDDLPPGYFMWPAFRQMIPVIREREEARVSAVLEREFARLSGLTGL